MGRRSPVTLTHLPPGPEASQWWRMTTEEPSAAPGGGAGRGGAGGGGGGALPPAALPTGCGWSLAVRPHADAHRNPHRLGCGVRSSGECALRGPPGAPGLQRACRPPGAPSPVRPAGDLVSPLSLRFPTEGPASSKVRKEEGRTPPHSKR